MDTTELQKKFDQIYTQKLEPRIQVIERERAAQAKKALILAWTFIFLFFGPFVFVFLSGKFESFLFMIPGAILGVHETKRHKIYRDKLKKQLFIEILHLFGNFNYFGNELITKEEIKRTGLFPRISDKTDDDNIAGVYNGLDVVIVETKLTHSEHRGSGRSGSHTVTDFNGLIVKIVLNKPFKGRIMLHQKYIDAATKKEILHTHFTEALKEAKANKVVNSDLADTIGGIVSLTEKLPLNNVKLLSNEVEINLIPEPEISVDDKLEEVILEDPEFNQMYAIYADDQVEARYILTPTFIERLKNIRDVIGALDVNCMIEDNSITLFIDTLEDFFEIADMYTPLNNKRLYQKMFNQLVSIFNLIYYFKLDKKLGL